ncbi:helix-turn-helix domain-containing protein [[Mycobacterium] zoologicum]|uniref:helix-turn-helix domain-containing protein n=1 Tax=[Mycobacterium] zoologicum TaxID=2872311 RepID=UPI002C1AFA20|nr:helix-turn-helix transcriptional regulator [Mycolicibacter sp. MYC101]MEB3065059.1 helix-turn-helix transcriptional regulator [Mycolicibacter sp. MYC101]
MDDAGPELDEDRILAMLGENVRAHRKKAGLRQADLAERAGLERPFISQLENGMRRASIVTLVRVAVGLGTTVSELTQGM